MESPYSELAELAADKKVSEDLIKQYKQRLKNYAESVAGNSPAEYKRHIQAIDDLIEAILNLGPVDPDNLSNKAILCALYTVKFSFILSADDVTAEEYSKIEKMVTVLNEEMKNKQAEAGNTEKKAEK